MQANKGERATGGTHVTLQMAGRPPNAVSAAKWVRYGFNISDKKTSWDLSRLFAMSVFLFGFAV